MLYHRESIAALEAVVAERRGMLMGLEHKTAGLQLVRLTNFISHLLQSSNLAICTSAQHPAIRQMKDRLASLSSSGDRLRQLPHMPKS